MLTYNTIALISIFFTISFSHIVTYASGLVQQTSTNVESSDVTAKTQAFKSPVSSFQIDCFDRRFDLVFDSANESANLFVGKDRRNEHYPIPVSPLSTLGLNDDVFVHPSFLCAQRGLSVYLEGYNVQIGASIKQLTAKAFISDNGSVSEVAVSGQHDDMLTVAKRLSATSIVNSLTGDARQISKFHGPWLPKEMEFIQKMSCSNSEYSLIYSPDNKRLTFEFKNNKVQIRRDLSDSVLLKIMTKRVLFLKPTFRCQENAVEIKYQGIAEMSEEIVEPITLLVKLNHNGQVGFFEQTDQLILRPESPPIRGRNLINEKKL